MNQQHISPPVRWILLGIPLLFLIGSIQHFVYQLCGEQPWIGCIAPVNESIWEHEKLIVWPVILWWGLYGLLRGKKEHLRISAWLTGGLASLLTALIGMPMLYYFYTGAWGIHLLVLDILILLVVLCGGQLIGWHLYQHVRGIRPLFVWIAFLIVVVIFAVCTFAPPHLPLFQDPVSGHYGIPFPS